MPAIPLSERGYTNPDLLIDTDSLAGRARDPRLRVIDTRSAELYQAGHIPGAVNLAAYGGIPRAENGDMAPPEEFSRLAGDLGVSADSSVVIYDAPAAAMGMAAWAFLHYGHPDVRILDGGFAKWLTEGKPTSTTVTSHPQTQFDATTTDELYCSLDHARAVHGSQASTVFWDVRTQAEYEGTSEAGNNARRGHIPGAVHLEWVELLDSETKTFKPARELRLLLESRGITPESEINCY